MNLEQLVGRRVIDVHEKEYLTEILLDDGTILWWGCESTVMLDRDEEVAK